VGNIDSSICSKDPMTAKIKKTRTCGEVCDLFKKSSNCNKSCSIKLGREDPHKCNSPQHMCKRKCSLPSCQNQCLSPIEFGDHVRHACHERYCQTPCLVKGCTRTIFMSLIVMQNIYVGTNMCALTNARCLEYVRFLPN